MSTDFFHQIVDAMQQSENDPDVIFASADAYAELVRDEDFSREIENLDPRHGVVGRVFGMAVYVRPEIDGLQMIDTTLAGWPKPADYE